MDTPGNLLRSEREKQKKSLEDIEKVLKIRIKYLMAIEDDNYDLLPADMFTKSYLRSYSVILGLEGDHILDLYNKQFKTSTAKEPAAPKKPLWEILSTFKLNYIYLLAICIGLVTIFVITYTKHNTEEELVILDKTAGVEAEQNKTETAPVEEAVQEKKDLVVLDKTAGVEAEQNKTETAPAEKVVQEEDLSLIITASELTWVSIKIDHSNAEELLLRTGESTTVTAHEKFVLKIGNAGGTNLILNGTDIGDLGPHGQLVDITLP
jgi:cytoskeletal protein RodZ